MFNLETNPVFGLENIPSFKNGSGIHIKKKNRGKFTKSAKAAGESVQEHAAHVLSDPNATPLLKKRANFARNAAKWHHKEGGILKNQLGSKILLGGVPINTNNKHNREILSWLPYTGTEIDIDNAVKDPSAENLTWAGLSVGLDALSFGVASRGLRAIKNMKNVLSEAIELTARSKKRYESARKTFNLSHNSNKKYKAMRRAELEYWDNYAKTRHDSEFDAFNGEYWRKLADLEDSYNSNKMLFGFGGTEILGVNTLYDKYKEENARTK